MVAFVNSKADELTLNMQGGKVNFQSYTTLARDAITTWVNGDVIYNSTTDKLNLRAGGAWEAITSA